MEGIQFGTKVHPKSKDFMWLFQISKLLKEITKGGRGARLCPFCIREESVQHHFLPCQNLDKFGIS